MQETKIADQGELLTITCDDDKKTGNKKKFIRIIRAMYGRQGVGECRPDGTQEVKSTKCAAAASLTVVQQECEGNKNCSILVSTHTFHEDATFCPGTNKYLEVS